jgi:hypothetical protein
MNWAIHKTVITGGGVLALILSQVAVVAALEYPSNKELGRRLHALAQAHPALVRVESLAKDSSKNEVWLVELGSGAGDKRKEQPAMLAVAGLEGNDLAGSAILLAWVEALAPACAKDEKTRNLLDTTTLYVVPRMNPEAAGHFFAKPKMEWAGNRRPVDDDHDGLVDEDGPEDLDRDGLITWMRVQDPAGEYIRDPADARLLLRADRAKGEVGVWKLFGEGIDNDHDEAWNEDGPGGVNLNRNFPYNYRFFAPWAGPHPMSETPTRALADFVVAHPNIGLVFTFGAADNLVQTPKGEAPKRPPTALHEGDIPFYRELGKAWREALGLKKELTGAAEPGTFSDWMYFDRGRLSLAARPWSPAVQVELAKVKDEKPKPDEPPAKNAAPASNPADPPADKPQKSDGDKKRKDEPDNRNEEDRAFLKWIDQNAPEEFVPWKEFKHPDFPKQKVEIGGFAPFARANPPQRLLEDYARKEAQFLTALAGKLPRVGLRKIEVKPLGNGVFDVTVEVENTGYLPTVLAQGALTRELNPTRLVLHLDDKAILSGTKRTMLGAIEGSGGMKDVRFILNGNGHPKVELEVVSALGGAVRGVIELKEEK